MMVTKAVLHFLQTAKAAGFQLELCSLKHNLNYYYWLFTGVFRFVTKLL